jgi:hypothetical protein
VPPCPLWFSPSLLLKQIIKRSPRTARLHARRSRCLLLARHPHLVQGTLIPLILLRHPNRDRLHALKPAPRIEIHALLTRMQRKPALWTLLISRHPGQHRATLRTPRHRMRSRQIHRPRTKRVVPLRWRRSARPLAKLLARSLTLVAIPILISMLPILSHYNPPQARAYCLPFLPHPSSSGGTDALVRPARSAWQRSCGQYEQTRRCTNDPGCPMSRVFCETWGFSPEPCPPSTTLQ